MANIELLQAGKKVFVRTLTSYFTGEIEIVTPQMIVLKDAAWVVITRFADFLKYGISMIGTRDEIVPYPDGIIINWQNIIAISPWKHDLPGVQR